MYAYSIAHHKVRITSYTIVLTTIPIKINLKMSDLEFELKLTGMLKALPTFEASASETLADLHAKKFPPQGYLLCHYDMVV